MGQNTTLTNDGRFGVTGCGNARCVLCKMDLLDKSPTFNNVITGKTYNIECDFNCNSANIIYLISCRRDDCCFQYVGKTTSKLKTRMNNHRSSLKQRKAGKHIQYHFQKFHDPSDLIVKPIEVCTDPSQLKEQENYWILELSTLYPFGLNERLEIPKYMDAKEEFDKGDTPIYSYFHKDLQKNETRKRGKRNKKSNRHTAKESFDLLWEKVRKESQDILKQMVTVILRLKKVECLKLARIIEDAICRLNTKTHNIQILKSMQDLCRYYLYRTKVIPTQPERGTFLSIKYSSQILERINFSRILNSKDIKPIFPLDAEAQSSITVCYSYGKPIRNKILNYKSCLVEETVDL